MLSNLRRLLWCSILLVAQIAVGEPSGSIAGQVKDPEGDAVADAVVNLVSRDNTTSARTVSDRTGAYRFPLVAPGVYLLSATAPGFETSGANAVEIGNTSQASVDLQMRVAAVTTSVTVTASGTAQTGDEVAKSVSVVDAQTINLLDKSTVADALTYLPGMSVQQLGGPGGLTSIKIRGLRNQDTAVLMDGFRLRDSTGTQADASNLLQDLLIANTDRIEVLRGTGSSIYGTDATGGVVNIITTPSMGPTHGSALLEGGSLDTFRGRGSISGSLLGNKLGYSLGAAHLNVVSGLDGNLPARTTGVQGRLDSALTGNTRLFARFFFTDSFSRVTDSPVTIGNLPGAGAVNAVALSSSEFRRFESGTPVSKLNAGSATFIPDYDDPDYNRAARTYSGVITLNSKLSRDVGFTASYQGLATHRNFTNGPLGVGYQPTGGNEIFNYDGGLHTLSGRLDWRLGKYQSINAGYEFENESYYGQTLEPTVADNSTARVTQRNHALFVQDQFHLLDGKLQVTGSYRAQLFTLTAPSLLPAGSAPYSGATFNAPPAANTWDASAAYLFRRVGTKLRTHVGTGYRAPSLYERFGTYFSSYYGYTAYGNPYLKPERTTAFDVGVDQKFWKGRIQASATYFYTRLNDVIVFGTVSPTDPFGRLSGYANTQGGIARGVESSIAINPARSLNLRAAYTFTNAREAVPQVPGIYQTFLAPDHQFSILAIERVTSRFTIIAGGVFGSSYLAPVFDSSTYASRAFVFSGIKRAQLGASYRLPLVGSRALRWFVNTENAFNQTYYASAYRTPGITAMSGAQFEF